MQKVSVNWLLFAGIILMAASGLWFYAEDVGWLPLPGSESACTMEAKLCSDGSYVGRIGPDCEFVKCPEVKQAIDYLNDTKYSGWTSEQMQNDCGALGGDFNPCGSNCSGTGPCIQVCVPKCEFSGIKTQSNDLSDISGWGTYRNEEYGLEFRYPSDLQLNENKGEGAGLAKLYISINKSKNPFSLDFSYELRSEDLSSLNEFAHNDATYDESDNKFGYEDFGEGIINGIKVYKFNRILGRQNNSEYFFFKNQNEGVRVEWMNTHIDAGKNPYQKIFEKILSTFKFIK